MNVLTISHYGMEPDIIIPKTNFFTFLIENKDFLLSVLTELREQAENGNEGGFHLTLNGSGLNIEKSIAMVFDFTNIDFNSKAITHLTVKKFAEFLSLGEQAESLTGIEKTILNLMENFRVKSGLNIEYDVSISGNNLAKLASLKIADRGQSLLERLCEYVNFLCDLNPLKLLILVFGKNFLTEENIGKLYAYCCDKGVGLMFIEGENRTDLLLNERRLVIDGDLCAIPQNYDDF